MSQVIPLRQTRSRWLVIVALAVLLANGLLLLPYVRALCWLHSRATPPAVLVMPVVGVARAALSSSFGAPRAYGPHEGIDILARAGTPVIAAADGVVIGNRPTTIGGNVLWILGSGRQLYYYAHLRELRPGMWMGRRIAAGEVIGSVGNSGDAVTTPPHLHFSTYLVRSSFYPLRYEAVDPYPLLMLGPSSHVRHGRSQPGQRSTPRAASARVRVRRDTR